MFLDAAVERRKFERECALLTQNAARLRARGAWVVRVDRPEIDVIFLPRLAARIGTLISTTTPGGLIMASAQSFHGLEFPALTGRPFGARFHLDGYDQRPPSITFHDPWTWELAAYGALPIAQLVDDPQKPMNVLLDGHPISKRPFLCLRGVREYHEHPQHDGDDWGMYRAGINVYVLIERLARVALASVRPHVVISLLGAGQMQINFQWASEAKP